MPESLTPAVEALTDEELTRAEREAWNRRLPLDEAPAQPCFGVQILNDWSDYRDDWCDRDDWDNDDRPIRFASAADAWAWVNLTREREYRRRHAAWATRHAAWVPLRERYEKRHQLLVAHDLWTQEGEDISPLLYPAGPGHEPQRTPPDRTHRVVVDSDMEEPVSDWLDEHPTPTSRQETRDA